MTRRGTCVPPGPSRKTARGRAWRAGNCSRQAVILNIDCLAKELTTETQRHRDTEKTKERIRRLAPPFTFFLFSLCLCVSVVSTLYDARPPPRAVPDDQPLNALKVFSNA